MTFANQLKFFKHQLGLTRAELAALLDLAPRTLDDWTSGKVQPHAVTQEGTIARLEKALAVAK
jgi:transcriptional regulator with XRE-family HTH domain